jgi:hypothetical protein
LRAGTSGALKLVGCPSCWRRCAKRSAWLIAAAARASGLADLTWRSATVRSGGLTTSLLFLASEGAAKFPCHLLSHLFEALGIEPSLFSGALEALAGLGRCFLELLACLTGDVGKFLSGGSECLLLEIACRQNGSHGSSRSEPQDRNG